jgi:hypothetical protein
LDGNVKVVLCIASDRVGLCQVANQKGRGYILSSQVVRVEGNAEGWLAGALAKFEGKLLKKIKNIVFATDMIACLPLDVFYLRGANFARAASFELENLLGSEWAQFKFDFWPMSEKQRACAFLISKAQLAQLLKIFGAFSVKNPRILFAPAMFADEARRQLAKPFTVFLNVGHNLLSFVFQSGAEQYVGALPINLRELAGEISRSLGRDVGENELQALLRDGATGKNDPQIQGPLNEFFGGLCFTIAKKAKEFFKGNHEMTFVVGGCCDALYPVAPHFRSMGRVQPYNVFFRSQISPAMGLEVLSAVDPFIPALLSAASLDKTRLERIAHLQSDAVALAGGKRRYFFYEEWVAGLMCCASALFYCAQKINCQALQSKEEHGRLLAQRNQLADLAGRIEAIDGRIKEQKKVLSDVLVYTEQGRILCEFLNALQGILFQVGDVYLTSFVWNTEGAQAKKNEAKSTKKSTKNAKNKAAAKQTESKMEEQGEASRAPEVSSSMGISGAMFIGNVEMTEDVKRRFNDKFNAMFEHIRRLPPCADVADIKVNAPENCKITFRCTLRLDPKSKVIAL